MKRTKKTHLKSRFGNLFIVVLVAFLLGIVGDSEGQTTSPDDVYWEAFGTIQEGQGLSGDAMFINTFGESLVVAGFFSFAGDNGSLVPTRDVAIWDGVSWHAIGTGVDNFDCNVVLACFGAVFAVQEYAGTLFIGGHFPSVEGGTPARNIAQWDGQSWQPVGGGVDGTVTELAVYNGELIVAGSFREVGGQSIRHIARWDGQTWKSMGNFFSNNVRELTVFQEKLVAAGPFTVVEGATCDGQVASWDGVSWTPLGDCVLKTGPGSFVVHNSKLYVGPTVLAGHSTGSSVVVWDGAEWMQVAEVGTSFQDLAFYNDQLIASGIFTAPGPHIIRWTGTDWEPLGSGTDGVIWDLEVWNGGLYVGGTFTMAGGKLSDQIARWDDTITPVEIEDFTSSAQGSEVVLSWRLSFEALGSLQGVHVQRAVHAQGPYEQRTAASLPVFREMSFADRVDVTKESYWYRLELIAGDGNRELGPPILVALDLTGAQATRLLSVIPNSQGGVFVRYRLSRPVRHLQLKAFDVHGRLLRVLRAGSGSSGTHTLPWDGRDQVGVSLGNGIYFLHLSADGTTDSRRVTLLR